MKDIKELMGEWLQKEGMGELKDLLCAQRVWADVVGEERAGNSRPYRLEDNRLYIGVSSHVWAQELHYLVEEIKGRLAEECGIEIREVIIKKINLK
jgi:predicted nucleic acid-binding Zn ribbon protein